MKILLLDSNHPLITQQLSAKGFVLEEDFSSSYEEVLKKIEHYDGVIIRSRIPIDAQFLESGKKLKFVARVGAGMENIDSEKAKELGIALINSPEGNRDAVAEHVLGMLLLLMNRLFIASSEVKNGIWKREENRGDELMEKTFGIIGYGNMGKATAQRLSGFGVKVIFYDILPNLSDEFASQVSLQELQQRADVTSLHIPLTRETHKMINENFILKLAHKDHIKYIEELENKYKFKLDKIRNIEISFEKIDELRKKSKYAIATSVSVTFELSLMGLPVIVVYKTSLINAFIVRKILKIKYITLTNLNSRKEIFPELLQEKFSVNNLIYECNKMEKNKSLMFI